MAPICPLASASADISACRVQQVLPDRLTVVPMEVADRQNTESVPFELLDLFHVFPPEQMSTLLCIRVGVNTTCLRSWGIFNWYFGDYCTGADNRGGSASTSLLSRPAQASHALRPAELLTHHPWALSRGFALAGFPARTLASYQVQPTTSLGGSFPHW